MLLRREGWKINAKLVYRLYDAENLKVRSVERKKIARRQRVPQTAAGGPNQCWSADFVSDKLPDGRSIRILTVIDQFTRERIWLEVDRSMNGPKVVAALTRAIAERGAAPRRGASPSKTGASSRVERWKLGPSRPVCNSASFGLRGRGKRFHRELQRAATG